MAIIKLKIKTLSPLHLSSGHADVVVDSEAAHDKYGMPIFSGRRLKGLLYESSLEVVGMKGMERYTPLVAALFDRDCSKYNHMSLIVSDCHLVPADEYALLCESWKYLQEQYKGIISPRDVLEEYTSIRYQTKMEDGIVVDGSFRNLRAVDENIEFYGQIEADELSKEAIELLALAVRNLRGAGMKRNRGFGRIICTMELEDKRTEQNIIEEIFGEEA